METLHLKTPTFEIANEVYNPGFNFDVEISRYILIREKLNSKILIKMLYQAFNDSFKLYSDPSSKKFKDPFLFPLTYNPSDPRFTELQVKDYNLMVAEILELQKLPITQSNVKTVVTSGYPMVFEVYHRNKRIFHQKVYNSKFRNFRKKEVDSNFPKKELELRMLAALLRYDILGFLNNASAAVSPKTYASLHKQGYSVELFASFYNCHMSHYFGLFYDLEHPFGCLGNLFTAQINYGKFVCNPPFEIRTMNSMVTFLKRQMELNSLSQLNSLVVYITVPVWYKKDREKLGKVQSYSEKSEFHKELLEPYIVSDELVLQKDYKFYSYLTGRYDNLCDVNHFMIRKVYTEVQN